MSAENTPFIVIEGNQISIKQTVFIREHRACSSNKGRIYEITGSNYKIACNKCARSDVVLDVPATLEALYKPKRKKR